MDMLTTNTNFAPAAPQFGSFPVNRKVETETGNLQINDLIQKSAKKTALPAGFITSSGNVYAYVNSVAVIRFTIDSGDNFGQLGERTVCVFISPEDAAEHNALTLNDFHIAYRVMEAGSERYKHISEPSQLPQGADLKLVRKTEDGYEVISASFVPEVGLIPVEKWSNADISGTHTYIGQKVASIISTRSAVILRMKATGKKCGKDDFYFTELEKMIRG